jgi:signal recognition particle GTPase
MNIYIAIALTMVIATVTGCKRDTKPGPAVKYNQTESEQNIADSEITAYSKKSQAQTLSMTQPQRDYQSKPQSQNEMKKGFTEKSNGERTVHHDSIPETQEQANDLMQRLDQEILNNELDPAVATYFKASFRGRLLAAGVSKDEIENWINRN